MNCLELISQMGETLIRANIRRGVEKKRGADHSKQDEKMMISIHLKSTT